MSKVTTIESRRSANGLVVRRGLLVGRGNERGIVLEVSEPDGGDGGDAATAAAACVRITVGATAVVGRCSWWPLHELEVIGELVTEAEVAAVNAARDAVAAIRLRLPRSWEGGMTSAACETASDGLFDLLNYLNSYMEVALSGDQVHNRKEGE